MTTIRVLTYVTLLVVTGVLGFAAGARYGFYEGLFVGEYTGEVASAAILIAHDGAEITGTNELIPEGMIDTALISARAVHDDYLNPPVFVPRDAYFDLSRALAGLARYRARNPSAIDDPERRVAIQEAVARFSRQ